MRGFLFGIAGAMLLVSAARADGVGDANAGMAALDRGDYAEAVRLFTKALDGNLSSADKESAYVERAKAYLGGQRTDLALADLDRALKLDPSDKEAADLRQRAARPSGGPPLDETLKFIIENISEQGVINYAAVNHDAVNNQQWVDQFTAEDGNVRVDPADPCRLDYHWKAIRDGAPIFDKDAWLDFRLVKSVPVISMAQSMSEVNAAAGHPTWTAQVNPPIAVVDVKSSGGAENVFDFKDADTANRVARAILHAVQLCGGGKAPF